MRLFFTPAMGLLAGLSLLTAPVAAQTLDPTFRTADFRTSDLDYHALGYSLTPDAQGRVVVGGRFNFMAGQPAGNVVRLLPSGARDVTFNPGGTGANGEVRQVVRLAGDRWLIAGPFTRYNGRPAPHLARLHPDGTLDTTFNTAAGPQGYPQRLVVDAQERIIGSGYFSRTATAPARVQLVRWLPHGDLDASFQPQLTLSADSIITALAVDALGRVLVAHHDGYRRPVLKRLRPDGTVDPSFGAGQPGLTDGVVHLLKVLANGQLLVVCRGGQPTFNGTPVDDFIRLNADGTLDSTFATPLDPFTVKSIAETPGGDLIVGGNDLQSAIGGALTTSIVRLQPDGALDTGFVGPMLANPYHMGGINEVVVGAGGELLVAGQFTQLWGQATGGFGRLLPTGAVDGTFTAGALDETGSLEGLVCQSGDRLIATGDFRSVNGRPAQHITRLLADGTPDSTFQPDPELALATLNRQPIRIDHADRLVVMAMSQGRARRFLPDGQPDPAFAVGSGPGGVGLGHVAALAVYPDGRVLVGGNFSDYNGVARDGVARLLADGTVDPSFQGPASLNGQEVMQLALLPDGSVVVESNPIPLFPGSIPSGTHALHWLDASGQPLATFNGGQPDTALTLVAALPDTSLLVRGWSSSALGAPQKLTRAGTVDPTFVLDPVFARDPTFATESFSVLSQPDGRLLILGEFSSLRPTPSSIHYPYIHRVTATGALDPTFRLPDFSAGAAVCAAFQSSGKLVVGGQFSTIDGTPQATIARLTNLVTGGAEPRATAAAGFAVFPNPAHATCTVRRPQADPATATLLDVLGRPVRRWPLTGAETRLTLGGLPAGAYVLRVVSATGVATQRVVVE